MLGRKEPPAAEATARAVQAPVSGKRFSGRPEGPFPVKTGSEAAKTAALAPYPELSTSSLDGEEVYDGLRRFGLVHYLGRQFEAFAADGEGLGHYNTHSAACRAVYAHDLEQRGGG